MPPLFPITGILQGGCWAVKLSNLWLLLWQSREEQLDQPLSVKRDSPGSAQLPHWHQWDGQHWIRLQSKKEEIVEMACHWIALISLRCSGNQAAILLEAPILKTYTQKIFFKSCQFPSSGLPHRESLVPQTPHSLAAKVEECTAGCTNQLNKKIQALKRMSTKLTNQ